MLQEGRYTMYQGIAASRGIGIGSICVIVDHELKYDPVKITDIDAEKKTFSGRSCKIY